MRWAWISPFLLLAAACAPPSERVLVAASFYDAARAVAPTHVEVIAGSSSTMAKQIVAGVQADAFVSAHTEWMDYLEERGLLLSGSRAELVRNRLVVVAARSDGTPTGPGGPPPALSSAILSQREGLIASGDPSHVPAGRYAKEGLVAMGLWGEVAPRILAATDVREALALVERGEADLGIVYATDARRSRKVRVVAEFPPEHAPAIVFEIATLRGGQGYVAPQMRRPQAMGYYASAGFAATGEPVRADAQPRQVRDEFSPLWLSLQVGTLATLIALVPAIILAWWLARTRSAWRPVVEAIVILPMVLPPVVVGYFLLVALGRGSPLGAWLYDTLGLRLAFAWPGAALAAMIMGFPLMVRAMRQGFEAVDPGLEQAAAVLGAGAWRQFFTVTLPLAGRSVVAGALLCFARSLGEFGATVTFAGNIENSTQTLPLAIWTALKQVDGEAAASRLTWICVGVAVTATLLCEWVVRRPRRARS